MKNTYKIIEKTTVIYLNNRKGDVFETFIDTEDFEKVNKFEGKWCLRFDRNTKTYYTHINAKINNSDKRTTYHMHMFILNCPKGFKIDHINHNTLDNRKENLRIVTTANNAQNRHGRNKNNKSGYRNVCWLKDYNKWCVQLIVEEKNKRLGFFEKDELLKAAEFAEQMREKYYGQFAGNG